MGVEVKIMLPDYEGYEYTGEFRQAEKGEYYHNESRICKWYAWETSAFHYHILRKKAPVIDENNPEPGYRLVTDWEKNHCLKPEGTKYWTSVMEGWIKANPMSYFASSNIYAIPENTKLQATWEVEFDWSVIPPWLNFVIQTKAGTGIATEDRPITDHYLWRWEGLSLVLPPAYAPKYPKDLPWSETLIARPGHED